MATPLFNFLSTQAGYDHLSHRLRKAALSRLFGFGKPHSLTDALGKQAVT